MKNISSFSVIGGDKRQLYLIKALKLDGFTVKSFGFGDLSDCESDTALKCLDNGDAVILPLPYSCDGKKINALSKEHSITINNLVKLLPTDALVFAGKVDDKLKKLCLKKNIRLFDYSACADFEILNAVPTAEGAIEIAMADTPYTLAKSKCTVAGYGKIGKILCSKLKSLDANITATARRTETFSEIVSNGYIAEKISDISKNIGTADIIFNTIPHMIFDYDILKLTKPDVLIIDLASRPGGVDIKASEELGRKVITALSLPGKCAPQTAGEIIKTTVLNIADELEV